jgi:hypothetical protein
MDVSLIRKMASLERGRRYLADDGLGKLSSVDEVLVTKAASAEDESLLRLAVDLPGDTLDTYEALGGKYKHAMIGIGIDVASFAEGEKSKGYLSVGFPFGVAVGARHKPSGVGAGIGLTGPVISWSPGSMAQYADEQNRKDRAKARAKSKKKTAGVPLWRKLAFGTPMFQMNPIPTPAAGPGGAPQGALPGQQTALKPPGAAGGAGGAGSQKPALGLGTGSGAGTTNPMQPPSAPKIPGASQGSGSQ